MTNVALCPNCGGQKTVSKPPYIAGDVNSWVSSSMDTYSCPTCDGRGWIRVDSVSQDDFDNVKLVALSSMETAENLMDECTKRADEIKVLEASNTRLRDALERGRIGSRKLIDRNTMYFEESVRMKTRIEELEAFCNTLNKACERREIGMLKELDELTTKNTLLEHMLLQNIYTRREEELVEIIDDLVTESERYKIDLELLNDILCIVNPIIKSGNYAQPMAFYQMLSMGMNELCKTVIRHGRKHDIVG